MTFQEAWDEELRASGCKFCPHIPICACTKLPYRHHICVKGHPGAECPAPSIKQFAEQVWARLEAAEARATAAQNRIGELEADVERLRAEVEAARECKERQCPYGLWRKALADTQGRHGEKEN